jgi:hypothetical protein
VLIDIDLDTDNLSYDEHHALGTAVANIFGSVHGKTKYARNYCARVFDEDWIFNKMYGIYVFKGTGEIIKLTKGNLTQGNSSCRKPVITFSQPELLAANFR